MNAIISDTSFAGKFFIEENILPRSCENNRWRRWKNCQTTSYWLNYKTKRQVKTLWSLRKYWLCILVEPIGPRVAICSMKLARKLRKKYGKRITDIISIPYVAASLVHFTSEVSRMNDEVLRTSRKEIDIFEWEEKRIRLRALAFETPVHIRYA